MVSLLKGFLFLCFLELIFQGSTPNGYALFSSETEQKSAVLFKKVGASGELVTDSKIISTLAKYLWMKENVEFRLRVIAALVLLIGAKVITNSQHNLFL